MPWIMEEGCLSKAQSSSGPTLLTALPHLTGGPAVAGHTSVALWSLAQRQTHSRHPVTPCY